MLPGNSGSHGLPLPRSKTDSGVICVKTKELQQIHEQWLQILSLE